jgi:homospermidine synthase
MNNKLPEFSVPFPGRIVMIGLGSIGKGLLPLLSRHIRIARASDLIVVERSPQDRGLAESHGAGFVCRAVTQANHVDLLNACLPEGTQDAFIINVANEVSSRDLIAYAAARGFHYIDTVVEPWSGVYFNDALSKADQTNYALREQLLTLKPQLVGAKTVVSCCGANPGMVSWLVKEALLNLATDLGHSSDVPATRTQWAQLMMRLGVKGIHIAERDSQRAHEPRQAGEFVNTWSTDGCVAECLQPAELGWGTHEGPLPSDGHAHANGCGAAIYLNKPGGTVKVQTWTPTHGNHFGFVVTHNEAISIADYFSLHGYGKLVYRPTCHYAYHPSDATVDALDELFSEAGRRHYSGGRVLTEHEIVSGADELGVLLYGHSRGAYWYGSRLCIEEARRLAPHQNATGLQVASAIVSGMIYAIRHPNEGLIEADEMDHRECLMFQSPYLGEVFGVYAPWQPEAVIGQDEDDRWRFANLRIDQV